MKIAFFDCFAGASGDMILGSLLDAGIDLGKLTDELDKLQMHGYRIQAEKSEKMGISGTRFVVHVEKDHHHRNLADILAIIASSGLDPWVKETSSSVFTRLAEAEARIHNKPVEKIHFHEVGAVDSIVDIVGACAALRILGIECVYSSNVHVGTGFLECAHGKLPVPPPASLELLKGVPVYSTGIQKELVTPTGAALLSTLSKSFGDMPAMQIEATGYGIGTRDLQIPNVLRVIIGQSAAESGDLIQLIETNIDDMNPQFYEHIMETLFFHGAKDVFLTPIIMKKNRPGVILSVLALPERVQDLINIMLRETTTLGVRISAVQKRQVLQREIRSVETPWGQARVKIRILEDGHRGAAPEYDDCKRLAQEHALPIQEVYEAVRKAAEAMMFTEFPDGIET